MLNTNYLILQINGDRSGNQTFVTFLVYGSGAAMYECGFIDIWSISLILQACKEPTSI